MSRGPSVYVQGPRRCWYGRGLCRWVNFVARMHALWGISPWRRFVMQIQANENAGLLNIGE